jgi:hypothetical protein
VIIPVPGEGYHPNLSVAKVMKISYIIAQGSTILYCQECTANGRGFLCDVY